jgi:ankyrin repeat protein
MLVSEFKANLLARANENDTPINIAVLNGHEDTVKMLITELGCSPQTKGFEGRSLLHQACVKGHTKLTIILITDFGLDPLSYDDNSNTPLHMACLGGHEELARLLITKYNCPVNVKNKVKETPLHKACLTGHSSIVRMLVSEFNADVTQQDHNNDTAVSIAAEGGHVETVQVLITELGCSPMVTGYDRRSLLHEACWSGSIKLVEMLITDFSLDLLSADDSGNTPLHMACWGGHEELARLLITKYNCPVDAKNRYKQTPLHIACFHGYLDVSKVLVTECMLKGDKIFYHALDKDNNTPLDLLIERGDTKAVHILSTEYGFKPHDGGDESKPLLHQLTAGGFTTMIQELISKYNYDPTCSDEDGNTILHTAAQHGQYEMAKLLFTDYSHLCPIDHRNSKGQTALHCACISGHTRVAKFLVANKTDITVRDEDGDTPLKKASLMGHEFTVFELFDTDLHAVDCKLLQLVCERGSVDLIDILLSDFHLDPSSVLDAQGNKAIHIAALRGHKQVVTLLIKKYKCPIDSGNFKGHTPLHLLCSQLPTENGDALIRMCISEFKADVTAKDSNGDQPIHAAAKAGYTSTVVNLISDHKFSPNSRGFKDRSLLHYALSMGHTSTAKTLIEVYHLSLHYVDEDGNTPLHLSSLVGQTESVRFLLFEYHAPVYVRNKAGKIALDLAMEDSTKKMIREYVKSEHKRIQREYDKLRAKSKQKYSGQRTITRVFVLGNSGSGKSTLVESLKRKGLSYLLNVPEADVPLHTAGIVPSVHQTKETGRLLYYDFAGDQEYYSSHAAILEMVSRSTVGSNVFLIVADLTKDDAILQDEIGYWLSFISYHGKALDSQCKLKVIVVLSHLDRLDVAEFDNKVDSARQCLQTHINQYNEVKFDVEIVSLNCRSPRSSKSIENILQQISKDTPPCSISYEASLLHGILEKDFRNVIACKFQKLLSSIEEIGIYLPSSADALHPIVRELHDIGLLMLIGRNEDELENYLLLLNPSSLTNEVHEKLFSGSAVKKLRSSIGPHFANMGILPESYLARLLPEHITKECLVQLQYSQEFNHAEVGLDYSVTSDDTSDSNLLYFPALCNSKRRSWSIDPQFTFGIGWYAECTEKVDYFPARFLHVLLLRLAYTFALPIVNRNPSISSNEISAYYSRRCTMWKNGIHWRMEEGVECIVEVVNDYHSKVEVVNDYEVKVVNHYKGIVVITKSKENSEEWAAVLSEIIDKAMQAKAEFCNAVSLHHFVVKSKSDDTSCYSDPENLFDIREIDHVVRHRKNEAVSVGGHNSLDASYLRSLRRHSYWGRLLRNVALFSLRMLKSHLWL